MLRSWENLRRYRSVCSESAKLTYFFSHESYTLICFYPFQWHVYGWQCQSVCPIWPTLKYFNTYNKDWWAPGLYCRATSKLAFVVLNKCLDNYWSHRLENWYPGKLAIFWQFTRLNACKSNDILMRLMTLSTSILPTKHQHVWKVTLSILVSWCLHLVQINIETNNTFT